VWFDPLADTTAFRTDATFEKTAALYGDAARSSFQCQWHNDSDGTRYLRHSYYHLFALLPATAQNNTDHLRWRYKDPSGEPPLIPSGKERARQSGG